MPAALPTGFKSYKMRKTAERYNGIVNQRFQTPKPHGVG
jgi:hypothetical protein